eukprot:128321_1
MAVLSHLRTVRFRESDGISFGKEELCVFVIILLVGCLVWFCCAFRYDINKPYDAAIIVACIIFCDFVIGGFLIWYGFNECFNFVQRILYWSMGYLRYELFPCLGKRNLICTALKSNESYKASHPFQCLICIGSETDDHDSNISLIKCGHSFHTKCLKKWENQQQTKTIYRCALCRQSYSVFERFDYDYCLRFV